MYILGLSCYYHDSAVALLHDGKIIAASEEERWSRKKHDAGFPKNAIDFCLREGRITKKDIDYIVFYEKPFRKFHRILLSSLSTYPHSYAFFREAMVSWLTKKLWIKNEIEEYFACSSDKILFTQHHTSHAASCFYPSPFKRAAILTLDGVGEWATTSFGIGEGNRIQLLEEIAYPHSLGLLYSTFTAFLGFEVNEGEWKVMGLAPYGKPTYKDKIWNIICRHPDGSFSLDLSYFSFHYSDTCSYSDTFIDLFGSPVPSQNAHLITQRSSDIAASIQVVLEELLLSLASYVRKKTQCDNLCLAGGVALNSVANERILKEGGFQHIYIQPAAGDSGGALGAALFVQHQILGEKRRSRMIHAYLGQGYSQNEITSFLKNERIPFASFSQSTLVAYLVDNIAKGRVVGFFQGKSEWGPRALGNRSILADPRNPKMKDIINTKVKFRENFRPFAPSVLGEKAHLVFDLPKNPKSHVPFRFMQYVVSVKKAWRKKVPAITHRDDSARPQLVFKTDNPFYYQLLYAFYKKTGVPLLLNTSFNLKGEPMVESPHDAYATFQRSGIDILVLGNCVVEKKFE